MAKIIVICRKISIFPIVLYQWLVSPILGNNCRFFPSCSMYAKTAVTRHGVLMGSYYTLRRLCRCHPWHEGGHDPVP